LTIPFSTTPANPKPIPPAEDPFAGFAGLADSNPLTGDPLAGASLSSVPLPAAPRQASRLGGKARGQKKLLLKIAGGVSGVVALFLAAALAYWGVGKLRTLMAERERASATEQLLADPTNATLAQSRGLLALPQLLVLLRDQDDQKRLAAVRAVGAIGEPAKESVPLMAEVLKTGKDPELIAAAADALAAIGPSRQSQYRS
jgi:hypothetical protein